MIVHVIPHRLLFGCEIQVRFDDFAFLQISIACRHGDDVNLPKIRRGFSHSQILLHRCRAEPNEVRSHDLHRNDGETRGSLRSPAVLIRTIPQGPLTMRQYVVVLTEDLAHRYHKCGLIHRLINDASIPSQAIRTIFFERHLPQRGQIVDAEVGCKLQDTVVQLYARHDLLATRMSTSRYATVRGMVTEADKPQTSEGDLLWDLTAQLSRAESRL